MRRDARPSGANEEHGARHPEMAVQQVGLRQQRLAVAIEDHAPLDEDDVAVGDARHGGVVLVDDHRRDAVAANLADDAPDLLGDLRREALGRLVEDEEIGVGHQRAADGEHLLLAARELKAAVAEPLREARKRRQHALLRPVAPSVRSGARGHDQVFVHGEVREDAATLGHVGDAVACDEIGLGAGHRRAAHPYFAVARLDEAQHAAEQRALAHPVAPHQAHGLAAIDAEIDAVQDVTRPVVRMELAGFED